MENNSDIIIFDGVELNADLYNKSVVMVEDFMTNMTPSELQEITGGYMSDFDELCKTIVLEVYGILSGASKKISDPSLLSVSQVSNAVDEQLRRDSLSYFIYSVLGDSVLLGWHHFEWIKIAETFNRIALLASRDHGKSFFWSFIFVLWMLYRYDPNRYKGNSKFKTKGEGFMFSHTEDKAVDYLMLVKDEIKNNPILRERLFLSDRTGWSGSHIVLKNGTSVRAKGMLSSARGYHPEWIVVDDCLNDTVLHSPSTREKTIDYFFSVIENMVVPQGKLVCVGTPFHQSDLYGEFRKPEQRQTWHYREYPALFPDGDVLWDDRYDYSLLMSKKSSLGTVRFSREFLCRPIASESSLFPWSVLKKSTTGMDGYKLVNNIEAFPIKFNRVVSGHDFAKSANIGADYTVFTVWGIDEQETMWLLYMWRKVGATFNEQIGKLRTIHTNFRPDIMILEDNGFQSIYTEFLQDTSMPIHSHKTGTNKHDLKFGLPSLAVLFERGKFKFPMGDEFSQNCADVILGEFNNITFTDKGIQSVAGHDDCVMSTWFGKIGATLEASTFDFEML